MIAAPSAAHAQARLRAIHDRFVDAWVTRNDAFMESLVAEDFVGSTAEGEWVTRAEYLARMRQGGSLPGAWCAGVEVREFGSTGIVHGTFQALSREDSPHVRSTDFFSWDGHEWKLVGAHDTTVGPGVSLQAQTGMAPASPQWPGPDPQGEEAEVLRRLNEHYVRAYRDADIAWYDAHLAPDFMVVQGDGALHDRAAAMTRFSMPHFSLLMKSFPVDRVRIRRFGDLALIHAENAYELKDGRRGISRYTDAWHRSAGGWRCVAAHITPFQAPM